MCDNSHDLKRTTSSTDNVQAFLDLAEEILNEQLNSADNGNTPNTTAESGPETPHKTEFPGPILL